MAEPKKTLQQRREENYLELLNSIEKCLAGRDDVKQTVLDLLEYIKASNLTIRNANPVNYNNWNVFFKGNGMGAIRFRYEGGRIGHSQAYIEENYCYIVVNLELFNLEIENFVLSENLSEVVWKNVKYCEGCLSTCAPGRDMTLYGKTLKNVCIGGSGSIRFINPNAQSLVYIKKLMEFRKGLILAGKV